MESLFIALFVGIFISVLVKACIYVFWNKRRHVPAQDKSPMRTSVRVLIAVSIAAVSTSVGAALSVMYVIFHVVVLDGGLAAGGHAINSGLDGSAVIQGGMTIGAVLGIGAALYFWHQSKPG